MKVVLFADSYLPYLSGVTVSIEALRQTLTQAGHSVMIFAPEYPEAQRDEAVVRIPSLPVPYVPTFRVSLPMASVQWNRLTEFAPDVFHAHSPFQMGVMAAWQARRLKRPLVYTMHTFFSQYGHYVPFLGRQRGGLFLSRWVRRFCNQSQSVIVPSEAARQWLIDLAVTSPITVVPSGIDTAEAALASENGVRPHHHIAPEAPLVMTLGRLAREKNLFFLLESFTEVLKAEPRAVLLIAAAGPYEEELRKKAEDLDIGAAVIFAGGIPRERVFSYLKAADLFVFSSKTETQGLVIAEAQACGRPVVAVNASGVAEIVRDGRDGLLVPEDRTVFANAVIGLLRDPVRRKAFGAAAAQKIAQEYSLGVFGRRVEEVYRHVL